jgi:hypothetical protein
MIYDGFVVLDTRDATGTETGFCGDFSNNKALNESADEPGVFAGPAGGGAIPPTLPAGGLPSGGGGGGGGKWLTPDTLSAGAGLLGNIAGMIGAGRAGRSPVKANVKAVCGRKPLTNIGGRKDKYLACAQNYMMPKQNLPLPEQGMSKSTKIIIGVLAGLVLLAIIITVIMLAKRKVEPVKS